MKEEKLPEANPMAYLGRRVIKVKGNSEVSGFMRTTGTLFYLEWYDDKVMFEDVNNGDIIVPNPETNPGVKVRVKYQM